MITTLLLLLAAAEPARHFEGKVSKAAAGKIELKLADGTTMGFDASDLGPGAKVHAGQSARTLGDIKPGDELSVTVANGGMGPIEEVRIGGGAAGAAGCPKEGHHLGKDAEGRDHCIRNGVMSCPKGFSQVMGSDSRFHCMSAPAAKCGAGQTEAKDKQGGVRCEMPNYDRCADEGYRVIRFPDGKYSCASPL